MFDGNTVQWWSINCTNKSDSEKWRDIGKVIITFSHFIEDLIFRRKKVISTKKYNQHARRVMKSIIFLEV